MSSVEEALKGLKNRLGVGVFEIFDGIVESVNEDEKTVNVQLGNDGDSLVIPDIRLRSVVDGGKDGFVCIPTKGSSIVFCKIEGESDYVLIKTSELSKLIIEIESTRLIVTKDGYEISRAGISLLEVLSDLKELLLNFKVNTPAGPSAGILPDSVGQLDALEIKFKKLLK